MLQSMRRGAVGSTFLIFAALAAIPGVCLGQPPPTGARPPAPSPATSAQKPSSAIPTEYAWVGDDGLTLRFRAALERAIDRSRDFDVSRRRDAEKLRLQIPTNLYWSRAQNRINFQYVVVFTNQDSKYLGVSIGSCWDQDIEIAECAQSVLRDAAEAWKRRHDPQPWPR
jgi:hypothetical protein